VIHGGDISDKTYGIWKKKGSDAADSEYETIWGQLYDAGIAMISAVGNHDYARDQSDELNQEVNKFVLQSYQKTKDLKGDSFSFEEFNDGSNVIPSYFNSVFRGVQIVNLNHYEPVERNTNQLNDLEESLDYDKQTIFFGHFPIFSLPEDVENEYKNLIGTFNQSKTIYLSGHAHRRLRRFEIPDSGNWFEDYVAPYPHYYPFPRESFDPLDVPGIYAVLVSPTNGVLQVKTIDIPYYEVSGCWANNTICGVGTTCNLCCYTVVGTVCGGELFEDGVLCELGTTCQQCKNKATLWVDHGGYDAHMACGTECWPDGTVCGAGSTCNKCCNTARNALGTKCGGDLWNDGTLCGLGTTCNHCRNRATYWTSKTMTACGTEPCWPDWTVCGAGTTCNKCCNTARNAAGTKCGGSAWRDGTRCALGTTCNFCQNRATWWWSKFATACGSQ